ncbi:hypothetical protein NXC24_CH02866 [Rhizobium sp. NXC24]|nr:hypothetical protein NXC24_CH02866 [Rhizobium sp. NXC24]
MDSAPRFPARYRMSTAAVPLGLLYRLLIGGGAGTKMSKFEPAKLMDAGSSYDFRLAEAG